jgi:hypothetical protein
LIQLALLIEKQNEPEREYEERGGRQRIHSLAGQRRLMRHPPQAARRKAAARHEPMATAR